MNNTALISVIIPVYNAERYLKRCVDSVLTQTYSNLEIIIVDDGSTDSSAVLINGMVSKYENISVYYKKNGGVSSSRNVGIKMAKGDFLTFVDADDWLEKDALMNMLELSLESGADCVRTMYYVDSLHDSKAVNLSVKEGLYVGSDIGLLLHDFIGEKESCFVFLLLIKKSLISQLQLFNEKIHMMEDMCYYTDILSTTQSIYISNTKTYHYFLNDEGASRSRDKYMRNINNVICVGLSINETLTKNKKHTKILSTQIAYTQAKVISSILFHIYLSGQKKELMKTVLILSESEHYKKILYILSSSVGNNSIVFILTRWTAELKTIRLITFFELKKFVKNIIKRDIA
jgi:glycosyltransferase involved in cell wall biosynthesis